MKSLRGFLSLRDLDVLHRARPLRVALEVGGDAEAGVRRRCHLMVWAGIVQSSRRHGGKRWCPCRFSLSVTDVRNREGVKEPQWSAARRRPGLPCEHRRYRYQPWGRTKKARSRPLWRRRVCLGSECQHENRAPTAASQQVSLSAGCSHPRRKVISEAFPAGLDRQSLSAYGIIDKAVDSLTVSDPPFRWSLQWSKLEVSCARGCVENLPA